MYGTVIDEGEDVRSERVMAAAGHAVAVVYHALYERGGADAVRRFPGGAAWVAAIEAVPARERHLALHEGHMVRVTAIEREAVDRGGRPAPVADLQRDARAVAGQVVAFAAAGVTEIAYQPAGPDIPAELARMADALRPVTD